MKKYVKKNSIVVLIFALLVCLFSSVFLLNKTETVKAEPISNNFEMAPGLAVSLLSTNPQCAISVSVTADQYNKLNQPTTGDGSFWSPYEASPYYLAVVRVGSQADYYDFINNSEFPSYMILAKVGEAPILPISNPFLRDYSFELYHVDPENSRCSDNALGSPYSEDGQEYYRLPINLPGDFEKEYYYFACFLEDKTIYEEKANPRQAYGTMTVKRNALVVSAKTGYTTRSIKYVAESAMNDTSASFSETQMRLLQNYAGINVSSEKTSFTFIYREFVDHGNVQKCYINKNISSWKVGKDSLVISEMLQLLNRNNIADFNVIRVNGPMIDKIQNVTDTSIYLQADHFEVRYNSETQTGEVEVIYRDFNYQNFAVRVKDNDINDDNELTAYINFTDVSHNEETHVTTMRLPYSGESADHRIVGISNQLFNSLGWIAEFDKDKFVVHSCPSQISVSINDNEIVVEFADVYEDLLKEVDIEGIAEIIPDYECNVRINYSSVSFEGGVLEVNNDVTETVSVMYSDYLKKYINIDYFKSMYLTKINNKINPASLNGANFMEVYRIVPSRSSVDNTFDVNVEYRYTPVLVVTLKKNNGAKSYKIVPVNFQESMTYNGAYIVLASDIPSGYRVQDIDVKDNLKESTKDYDNYRNSTFTFECETTRENLVTIPVDVILSDTVIVRFDYFERYYTAEKKATPFATKESFETTIKYSDFDDYFTLTNESKANFFADLITDKYPEKKKILEDKLKFLGLVEPDASLITYTCNNNGVYAFDIPYSYMSVKAQESDGTYYETAVCMTKYSDWTKMFGADWGIMMLNHPNKIYFPTNNTEIKNKLYALFGVVVFKEQQQNINDWFNERTNDGCIVEFTRKEVVGSDFYKFVNENDYLKNLVNEALGIELPSVLAVVAEKINDDNGINYSHFFYVDGTLPYAYVSNSGATDYDDNDPAIRNRTQQIGDAVLPYVYLIGGLILCVLAIYFSIKIGMKLSGWPALLFTLILVIGLIVAGYFHTVASLALITGGV